jgi:hypothetical protein
MDHQKLVEHRSRGASAALREKLLEKHGHACAICGVKNAEVPLELAHLIPVSQGGETTEDNLTILCPNCYRTLDSQPRELEFINFLADVLQRHPLYHDVTQGAILGRETRFRAGILAKCEVGNQRETLLIECKSSRVMSSARISDIIAQLKMYGTLYGD